MTVTSDQHHHQVQFLSGVIPVYGGGRNYLILKCPNTPLPFGTVESIFVQVSFFKLSLTFPLHVFFGRHLFLFPRTSKSNATFSELFSSVLRTYPNHRNAFAFAVISIEAVRLQKKHRQQKKNRHRSTEEAKAEHWLFLLLEFFR